MKYELVSQKTIKLKDGDKEEVFEVKCIPSALGKFFFKKEKIVTLIDVGRVFSFSGKTSYRDINGNKYSPYDVASWLDSLRFRKEREDLIK